MLAGIVILGVWAAGAAAQNSSCDPSCPVGCVPGTKVPNPRNCAQYYTCLQDCLPSDEVFDCDEGQLFDVETAQCQPNAGGVTCGYCVPQCSYTCDGNTELAAVREDCSQAKVCSIASEPTITCSPELPYFDGIECQGDINKCCDPCEVFCEAPFTEVMDPYSCTSYYYCSQVGYPLPDDKFECDAGEIFLDGHCRTEGDCIPACTGDVSPSSSLSSTESTSSSEGMWAAGAAAQGTSCDPSCPKDCVPGTKVPNPRNCAQYHTCLDDCTPSDPAFECDEGQLFDVVTAQCQPDAGGVVCGYCLPQCSYTCDNNTQLAAVRDDCTVAILCSLSSHPTITCSEPTLYFNGTACQEDESQCCDPCEVFCQAPFTEITDPASCTSYYYCSQVGYPLEEDKYECDAGEVFLDGHCRPSEDPADCITIPECAARLN